MGDFWSLYFYGIQNVYNIKWTLIKILFELCMSFVINYSTNKIVAINNGVEKNFISTIIIYGIFKIINPFVSHIFIKLIKDEQLNISVKITDYVNKLYCSTSFKWKENNTNNAQKESLNEIFNTYNNMSNNLRYTINSFLNMLSILIITFMNDTLTGIFVIISSIIMFYLKKNLDKMSKFYEKFSDTSNEIQLCKSNLFTLRSDILHNQKYKNLYDTDKYNPNVAFISQSNHLNNQHIINNYSGTIITILEKLLLVIMILYVYYVNKINLISYVIINGNSLFSFFEIIQSIEDIKNISQIRLLNSFVMILSAIQSPNAIIEQIKINKISKLEIFNISKKITDKITLNYKGKITIDLTKLGIVLFNGKKGCGKSITADFIAGFYDDNVTDGVFADGIELKNEFRDLLNHRIYVSQCISDNYRSNTKNTITMTLNEMFTGSSYDELTVFIANFDIVKKMPSDMVTKISTNERGLSPGEIQSFVLASQIWNAIKLDSQILILDEPERNIDFDTCKKIFRFLKKNYTGIIFLITHSSDLKNFISEEKMLKQKWNYNDNNNDELSFEVETIDD
jgi:ABC-type multidrug transport system ATPase subunit